MIPHRLCHIRGKAQDDRLFLTEQCIKALSLKQGEADLLRLYVSHSDGFAPSIQFISSKTGLDKRSILRNRSLLIEDGLIALDSRHIFIDWSRIRLFAALGSVTSIPRQRKKRYVSRVRIGNETFSNEQMFRTKYSMPIESLTEWLSSLTDERYEEWVRCLKKCHHNIYSGRENRDIS